MGHYKSNLRDIEFNLFEVLGRGEDFTSVGGVNPGTRIIVEGAGFLGDGDRVTVAPSA